jgi:hypothetical protein
MLDSDLGTMIKAASLKPAGGLDMQSVRRRAQSLKWMRRGMALAIVAILAAGTGAVVTQRPWMDSTRAHVPPAHHGMPTPVITKERKSRSVQPQREPDLMHPADGRYFGFISSIDSYPTTTTMVFDPADFLTGARAQRAAEQAGVVKKGEPVPADYYIRNVNHRLHKVLISSAVHITLSTWDRHNIPNPKRVDLPTLERIVRAPRLWEQSVVRNGYWMNVVNGRVVKLEEQYVP